MPLRVLIVDSDTRALRAAHDRISPRHQLFRVETIEGAIKLLETEQHFDVVLTALSFQESPGFSGGECGVYCALLAIMYEVQLIGVVTDSPDNLETKERILKSVARCYSDSARPTDHRPVVKMFYAKEGEYGFRYTPDSPVSNDWRAVLMALLAVAV